MMLASSNSLEWIDHSAVRRSDVMNMLYASSVCIRKSSALNYIANSLHGDLASSFVKKFMAICSDMILCVYFGSSTRWTIQARNLPGAATPPSKLSAGRRPPCWPPGRTRRRLAVSVDRTPTCRWGWEPQTGSTWWSWEQSASEFRKYFMCSTIHICTPW